MTGIEMTRMRPMITPSETKKETDPEQGADFLQMLKDRQQAAETVEEQSKPAVGETNQENAAMPDEDSGGKDSDAADAAGIPVFSALEAQLANQMLSAVITAEPAVEAETQPVISGEEAGDGILQNMDLELQQEPSAGQIQMSQGQDFQGLEESAADGAFQLQTDAKTGLARAEEPVQKTETAQENTSVNIAEHVMEDTAKPQTGQTESESDQPESELFKKTEAGNARTSDAEPAADRGAMQLQNQVSREPAAIQAADTPKTPVRTTQAELPADLGKAIAARMPSENGTLTIELEPASLGKVTIQVVYENGRASLSLMASDPKTLEILSRNAGEIAGILENKTGQETVIYTYEPEQDFADSRENGGENRGGAQEQKEDQRKEQPDSFLQQLRLGLV